MRKFEHLCFDLDGTIVHSAKTIYKTTVVTLEQLNIEYQLPENEFNQMIGQHFRDIFNHFRVNVPDFEVFIRSYKQNYFDYMNYSELYANVAETLALLKEKNLKISLLTTKAQDQAERIINHFNLEKYFDLIMGRRDGIPHKPSPEPLYIICNNLNAPVEKTLMIGDTELDILCGRDAGAKTCAVTFGYRETGLLQSYNPDFIIHSFDEITGIVGIFSLQ